MRGFAYSRRRQGMAAFRRAGAGGGKRVYRVPRGPDTDRLGALLRTPPGAKRKCAGCEDELQRTASMPARAAGDVSATVASGTAAGGQPLSPGLRQLFEPRFGEDFGHVRLHTGAAAAESANALNARAYTFGRDIVFGAGEYSPDTIAGRRLLAHELSHTIQQGAAPGARAAVQRSMKFEFQTRNTVTTDRERKLGRKFGFKSRKEHYLHKGKSGVELQTDTGGVVEFETGGWFRKWSKLREAIQEAADIVAELNRRGGRGFPFSAQARLESEGFLRKGERLEVDIRDEDFKAKIQSSESLSLSQYESFLNEHELARYRKPVIASARRILDDARKTGPKAEPAKLANLRGFLQVLVNYILRGQRKRWLSDFREEGDVDPVKATFRLMHRTSFAEMYGSFLNETEQALFVHIVESNAIQEALKIAVDAPFFKEGYWGHDDGLWVLYSGGKVVALATEDKKVTHDCASTHKPEGINTRACGRSAPETDITVDAWLGSIIRPKKEKWLLKDLLSKPPHSSEAMGRYGVILKEKGKDKGEEKPSERGLVRFEARGTAGHKEGHQPAKRWVDYVEEVFVQAYACRPRPNDPDTELVYDGTRGLDPARVRADKCPDVTSTLATGVTAGSASGDAGLLRGYAGLEWPVSPAWSFTAGVAGTGLFGGTGQGAEGFVSALGGVRLGHRYEGPYLSLFAGPALAINTGSAPEQTFGLGAEAGAALGYRGTVPWLNFQVDAALTAGVFYDPLRDAGARDVYYGGVSIGVPLPWQKRD